MIDVFTLNTEFTTHFLPNSSAVRCDVYWYQLWCIIRDMKNVQTTV